MDTTGPERTEMPAAGLAAGQDFASAIGSSWLERVFEAITSALCYSFVSSYFRETARQPGPLWNGTTRFVLRQHARMPDYMRNPVVVLTLLFDLSCLITQRRVFRRLGRDARWHEIERARRSRLRPFRDLVRFYESLAILGFHAELDRPKETTASSTKLPKPAPNAPAVTRGPAIATDMRCQVAVIGSGPGGAITAALLAEAGRDVVLLEAGADSSDCEPFSAAEMEAKYRNGGVTAALGPTRIAYAEAHCVGGGSEINAGLYHRTPDEILDRWHRQFRLVGASPADMREHFETCERAVNISSMPPPLPPASLRLHEGAQAKGWKSIEVPRWFKHELQDGRPAAVKQTMSRTYIPRAVGAGARLVSNFAAQRLRRKGSGWAIAAQSSIGGTRGRHTVVCDSVFVCAGAIRTPALLLASGIISRAGLRMHPSIKVVARFPDTINGRGLGVPVHQVKEFSPRLSFGCSISQPAHLALSMVNHPHNMLDVAEHWPQMAAYYVMSTGGSGRVRCVPGYGDPLVNYSLSDGDMHDLADGLHKLCEMLFAAGATILYLPLFGMRPLRSPDDLRLLPDCLPQGSTSIMTIHLTSSCPMGEDKSITVADSYGRVHGQSNLHIADASLLCTAPSVNPQGSVMAFAHRCATHYLQSASGPVHLG
jgi:choline dehydrogenase-like flavoprotein